MTDQTQTTVNTPLLAKVLDHIVAHPEEWNQMWWGQRTACGTAYCVAGHAVVMSGHDIVWDDSGRAQRTESSSSKSGKSGVDCRHCGTSYAECTEELLSGSAKACCGSCHVTDTHDEKPVGTVVAR